MAGAAPQGIAAAVEKEALLRVDLEPPAAEAGADLISAVQGGGGGIEIGIVHAVPQPDIFNGKGGLSRHGECHIPFANLPGLHRNLGGPSLQIHHRCDFDTWGAAMLQCEMGCGYDD